MNKILCDASDTAFVRASAVSWMHVVIELLRQSPKMCAPFVWLAHSCLDSSYGAIPLDGAAKVMYHEKLCKEEARKARL